MRGYESQKSDYAGKIKELEDELSRTKYNKRTQHHIGLVKAKIAELKQRAEQKKKGSGITSGYSIKKNGDATVAMLGFPSVGKSTLLNALTKADSKVGAYDFTTLDVIPGLLEYGGAKIQLFDVPGIIEGAASGSGRGKEVLAAIRAAELIVMVIDFQKPQHYEYLMKEAWDAGLRLNVRPPDVKLKRTGMGGIDLTCTCKQTHLNDELIKDMLRQMGWQNCQIVVRQDITDDDLIDVIAGNRVYIPSLVVINKADIDPKKAEAVRKQLNGDICISANEKENLVELQEGIFKKLGLVRIYTKEQGKDADMGEPLVLQRGATIRDVCNKLHRTFVKRFKTAKVWGSSKFPGQSYGLDKEVKDKDIVEVHLL